MRRAASRNKTLEILSAIKKLLYPNSVGARGNSVKKLSVNLMLGFGDVEVGKHNDDADDKKYGEHQGYKTGLIVSKLKHLRILSHPCNFVYRPKTGRVFWFGCYETARVVHVARG